MQTHVSVIFQKETIYYHSLLVKNSLHTHHYAIGLLEINRAALTILSSPHFPFPASFSWSPWPNSRTPTTTTQPLPQLKRNSTVPNIMSASSLSSWGMHQIFSQIAHSFPNHSTRYLLDQQLVLHRTKPPPKEVFVFHIGLGSKGDGVLNTIIGVNNKGYIYTSRVPGATHCTRVAQYIEPLKQVRYLSECSSSDTRDIDDLGFNLATIGHKMMLQTK